MQLNIIVDDYSMDLYVPDDFLEESRQALDHLDSNMDQGIQFGPGWLEQPDRYQRCQFAANKLLTALETDNEGLAMLSAGYILSRLPGVSRVKIDTSGEPWETKFERS